MVQPGLCLLHRVRFNAEGQVLGLGQTIIALGQLLFEHLAVLGTDGVELVLSEGDADTLLEALRIGTHIHKGQLKVDGAVEEIQEAAPLIEDGGLIFLLRQLVVDVLELDGLGVVVVRYPADAVREHTLERDGLLCSPGNAAVRFGTVNYGLDLPLLCLGEISGHSDVSCFRLSFEEQWHLPPFQVAAAAQGRHRSCWSGRDGSSVEGTSTR